MRTIRNVPSLLILLATGGIAACGGSGGTGTNPPPPPPPPGGLAIAPASPASGEGQQGAAGMALANPVRVQVTRGGTPEAGVTVNWAAAGTGAGVNPSGGTTGVDGIASTTWTLPRTAGAASVTATVSGAAGSPVSFHATSHAGAASQIAAAGGSGQSAPAGTALAAPFQVRVSDAFGNPVQGTTVTWTVAAGAGDINPSASTTGANGTASATLTLGPVAGVNSATGAAAGLLGSPVTFTATGSTIPSGSAVAVQNDFFSPAVLQTTVGGTVTWTWSNTGSTSHSVQSLGAPGFTSSAIQTGSGSSYAVTFTTAGTYHYDCAVHGAAMSGTIIVQ